MKDIYDIEVVDMQISLNELKAVKELALVMLDYLKVDILTIPTEDYKGRSSDEVFAKVGFNKDNKQVVIFKRNKNAEGS